jgi:hypothetical protein
MVDVSSFAIASWQKSKFSSGVGGGECVEIACTHERVWVRDSKNACGPILGLTREGWVAFLKGVGCDEFACPRESA